MTLRFTATIAFLLLPLAGGQVCRDAERDKRSDMNCVEIIVSLLKQDRASIKQIEQATQTQGRWLGDGYNIRLHDPIVSEIILVFRSKSVRSSMAPASYVEINLSRPFSSSLKDIFPYCDEWSALDYVSEQLPYAYTCKRLQGKYVEISVSIELTDLYENPSARVKTITLASKR